MADKHIITRDKFIELLNGPHQIHVIGRALVHLFNRQTDVEQRANNTRDWNEMGFTGVDGRSGCITAKYYLKHRTLLDWQIERWMKPNKHGIPRIAKYWKQIDEEARKKANA